MGRHTGPTSHWDEAGWLQLYGETHWTNITLGWSRLITALWGGTHWTNITLGWGRLTTALWGDTLDQHHSGLRQVDNSSMGRHTEPTSHWVEAGWQLLYRGTHWINITLGWGRLTTALWGHILDQHHTGLKQVDNSSMEGHTGPTSHWVEAGWQQLYGETYWINITLGWEGWQ